MTKEKIVKFDNDSLKFMYWILVDKKYGIVQYTTPQGGKAIKKVADLLQKKLNGKNVTKKQWLTAAAKAHATTRAIYMGSFNKTYESDMVYMSYIMAYYMGYDLAVDNQKYYKKIIFRLSEFIDRMELIRKELNDKIRV